MRPISEKSTRINWPRIGTSTPSSRSTAMREGMLLVHRRDIVEAVEIRHGLKVGLGLDQLFRAAMQQPDMRIDAVDNFAVEFQHEAQNAMRRRVLRPEIDIEVADGGFSHGALRSEWGMVNGEWSLPSARSNNRADSCSRNRAAEQTDPLGDFPRLPPDDQIAIVAYPIRPFAHSPFAIHHSLLRLLVARQHVVRAFPWRHEIEIAEFLLEFDRLVDHALCLVVVAHFDEAGQREVLAQRVALEAIVGEQPAQIRMVRKTGCRRGRRPRARTSRRPDRRRWRTAPSYPRRPAP